MKRVWIHQYKRDVERIGDKASWYVGWVDHDGKRHGESCGPGSRGRKAAEKRKRQLQGELDNGIHQPNGKVKWATFRAEYEAKVLIALSPRSQEQVKAALDHFERIVSPGRMEVIRTQTIDDFIAKRRVERGKKPGSTVSPATVNKDLRHLKAALRVAVEWGYLLKVPRCRMQREPEKLPRYVTPEHFHTLYHKAAAKAEFPQNPKQHYTAAEWWQALITTAYMTGLRINEILAVRWDDVDLDNRLLITRAEDNKANRDESLPLHPVVVEHLEKLRGFHPLVFRWRHEESLLWNEFNRMQAEAGIKLPCNGRHKHTPACHTYGFHDLETCLCHGQCTTHEARGPTAAHEAQELPDHASVREPGEPASRRRGRHADSGHLEGDRDGIGLSDLETRRSVTLGGPSPSGVFRCSVPNPVRCTNC